MDRLRQIGEIIGYTIILAGDATDMPVRCIVMVAIAGHVTEKVVKALGGFPEVSAVHTTNGRWDLVVELGTTTLPALDAVLSRIRLIPGITGSETSILLATPRSAKASP